MTGAILTGRLPAVRSVAPAAGVSQSQKARGCQSRGRRVDFSRIRLRVRPVEVTPVSRKGWLLFIALCVIWGIPYLLIRVAVRELPPPALVFLRTAPAALLLVPLALHRGELRPLLARWRWVGAYTAIELAIPWLLLAHAEQRISSSLAGLLVAAVPQRHRASRGRSSPRCRSSRPCSTARRAPLSTSTRAA
jgi:hypothetical protein